MMKKRIATVIMAALLVGTFASCGDSVNVNVPDEIVIKSDIQSDSKTQILGEKSLRCVKYTLYIGLNDKDTYEQKISTEEALEKANKICAEYAGVYTQFSANRCWTDDEDNFYHENTLVYLIDDISEKNLKAMLDELLKEFNQSAIIVEKESTEQIYYTGK